MRAIVGSILVAVPLVALSAVAASLATSSSGSAGQPRAVVLLNASYDATRELYDDYNRAFAAHWLATTGQEVRIEQSHGGSGKQARSVLDGLPADVVTLAQPFDIDVLHTQRALVAEGWQERLPHRSSPCTTTIVFLVREGNPKSIHDWEDLVREDVKVITPNPKTSGGARWNYLAAWGAAQRRAGGDASAARDYMTALFRNVPVLDAGARGSATTFVQRRMGDVLLAWESEAYLCLEAFGNDRFDVVYPSISIEADTPVAVVDHVVDRHGTREVAEAYLRRLYSPEGQEILARHWFRPLDPEVAARHHERFPEIERFTVDELFGSWSAAQAEHFDEGGVFDRIVTAR